MTIDTTVRRGSTLELEMKSIGGSYRGDFSADEKEIAGRWSQGGRSWPLVFRRS